MNHVQDLSDEEVASVIAWRASQLQENIEGQSRALSQIIMISDRIAELVSELKRRAEHDAAQKLQPLRTPRASALGKPAHGFGWLA